MAEGLWKKPVIVIQKVQIFSTGDGRTGIAGNAPLTPVGVNDFDTIR